jgi:hypothetical protein
MPYEIIALIEKPHLLVAVLFVGAVIGMVVEQFLSGTQKRVWWPQNRSRRQEKPDGANIANSPWVPHVVSGSQKPRDSADQLRIVMGADFTIQPLLNKSEARVFMEVESIVTGCNPAWQVMAQVSLGEILRCKNSDAFSCINSKRVDLLLVDADCRPRLAIEYQGAGHYQSDAAARDAVKREALRRAGIGFYEVVAGRTTPSDLKRLIEKMVSRAATPE